MRSVLIIALLAVLTGLSFVLMRSLQKELSPPAEDKHMTVIATAYGVRAKFFSKDNQLRYDFQSPEVTEFSQDGGTSFVKPHVKVFNAQHELSWLGRAENGHLSSNHDDLIFRRKIWMTAFPNTPKSIDVRSEELAYSVPEQQLQSHQSVSITGQGFAQQADSYVVYLPQKRTFFSGNVTAHYQPQTTEDK